MLGFLRNITNNIQQWLFGSPQAAINSINFDPSTFFPNGLSPNEREEWINTYLNKFPNDTLLLWCNEKNLHASCLVNGNIDHVALKDYEVNHDTKVISRQGKELSSLAPILKELKLPSDIAIPTKAEIKKLKTLVYIERGYITAKIKARTIAQYERELENISAATNCYICHDIYTKNHKPYMVKESGQVYHKECIEEYAKIRREQKVSLKDPVSNVSIQEPLDLTEAVSHFSLLGNCNALLGPLEVIQKMLKMVPTQGEPISLRPKSK